MYRKKIYGILIICTLGLFGINNKLNAQDKPASSTEVPGSFTEVSLKNNKVAESQQVRGEDVVWKRDVYRIIDLKTGQNGALYYPIEADEYQRNLLCTIFDLLLSNKVTAYKYMDGREIFTDLYAIKFQDELKKHDIPYKVVNDPRKPNVPMLTVDASDIPSADVTKYYIKEVWFLDQRNSSLKVKTTAICPLLLREDETGELRSYPLFWIPFESLKPYLSQMSITADSLNSANRLNAYDYFNQRRYNGELYKVSNLRNQNITEYCKTPEAVKAEQERLEKELKNMDSSLWEPSQKLLREEADLKKANEQKAKQRERKK